MPRFTSTRSLSTERCRLTALVAVLLGLVLGCSGDPDPAPTRHGYPPPKIHGMAFAPFRDCQSPDLEIFPTSAQMRQDVDVIGRRANAVRTYSVLNGGDGAAIYAQQAGLRVSAGAWLGKEDTPKGHAANRREIDTLVALAQRIPLESVIVGNEVRLRGDLSTERLATYIREVKSRVPARVPVTTAETAGALLEKQNRPVADAVDYLMVHVYPYWEGRSIDGAAWNVADSLADVRRQLGKPVVIGETGWPSAGPPNGGAVPSPDNARRFLAEWKAVAAQQKIDYYYFAAFDEMFKTESGVGSHWGILSADRKDKFAGTDLRARQPEPPARPGTPAPSPTAPPAGRVAPIYTEWLEESTEKDHDAPVGYVPSGLIGDRKAVKLNECWLRDPHAGNTSIKAEYSAARSGGNGWAGVYWQSPENNWGTQKEGGRDRRGYRTLSFYARGDKGGERVTFFSGGITGRYPDTMDKREIVVKLTKAWRRYAISLRDADLRRVVGAFGWSATREDNPSGATFYLDDVQFDMSTPPRRLCLDRPSAEPKGTRYILDRDLLCANRSPVGRYDFGVDTNAKKRTWLSRQDGFLRMKYPANQQWGAVFLTVGTPVRPGGRPGQNLSGCRDLVVDLRAPGSDGLSQVEVGIKDSEMPDDGSEVKRSLTLDTDWKTHSFRLRDFTGVELWHVYVIAEFVFSGLQNLTVDVRDIRLRCGR